jgi:dynein heavy chain, axonemal
MLEIWSYDFALPNSVWISGLFNPQSFLTSVMQETSRQYEWPLDKMCLKVEVTKQFLEEITQSPIEGVYLHGLYMEGARWDLKNDCIVDPKLNEIEQTMPVFHICAFQDDKREHKNTYECPIYRTKERGPTYVWSFNLKTNENPTKWIIGSVCMLCSI